MSINVSPRVRVIFTEMFAEGLGIFFIVFFGTGSGGAHQLGKVNGDFVFGLIWGFAVLTGIISSAAVSSAHLNPAVTLAVAFTGKLPLWKIPHFLLAQFLGAFAGAGAVYSFYWPTIKQFELQEGIERGEPGSYKSAAMFVCSLNPHLSAVHGLIIEWFLTGVLLTVIGVINDRNGNEGGYGPFFPPLFVAFSITILTASFAGLSSTCMNPARELSPRLVAYLAGWGRSAFPGEAQNPFWIYIVGPIAGGITGACFWEYIGSRTFKFVADEKKKALRMIYPSFEMLAVESRDEIRPQV